MSKKSSPPFTVEDVLQDLYRRIPNFECEKGCTECCGVVPWSGIEWERIEDKRLHTSIMCPYAVKGKGCVIYEQRPLTCRLFGSSVEVQTICPKMRGPKKPLSKGELNEILDTYKKILVITGLYINGVNCSDKENAMASVVGLLDRCTSKVGALKTDVIKEAPYKVEKSE